MTIGAAIKAARGTMTQDDLAEKLKTKQPTISKWESGKERPSLELLRRIEKATGRSKGFIVVAAGFVDTPSKVEGVIAADPNLDEEGRQWLLRSYRSAVDSGRSRQKR